MKNKLLVLLLLLIPFNVYGLEKEEMVYSFMDYDSNIIKTTVTSHLKNIEDDVIYDDTYLQNIININGKEKFSLDNNRLTWNSLGSDIFYKGESLSALPISTKIEYYLDDVLVKPNDIINKSGNVKIVLSFTNNLDNYISVDGIYHKLYTPFVVMGAMTLDVKSNSNIDVNNGRVISNGTKNIIMGIASPGLYDSTGIDSLNGLDSIVISYYTKKFSLDNLYIMMKPKLIDNTDLTIFDKVDSLTNSVYSLKSNMDTIVSSYGELTIAIDKLNNGADSINSSLKKIYDNLSLISDGATNLDDTLKEKIFDLNNKISSLTSGSYDSSLNDIYTLISNNTNTIISLENMNASIKDIYDANDLGSTIPTNEELVKVKTTYESNLKLINLLNANNNALSGLLTKIANIKDNLNTLTSELGGNLSTLSGGISTLADNLSKLKNGVYSLYNGFNDYNSGINALNTGSDALYDGLSKYQSDGIDNLYNYSLQAKHYSNIIKTLIKLSNDYNGFASSNCDDSIFVIKIGK